MWGSLGSADTRLGGDQPPARKPRRPPMVVAEFGTGQVFLSMLYFFLFFLWIWLVITLFADIFRSPDLSGWGKAGWSLFLLVLPFLGAFVYVIARGDKMAEHAVNEAKARDEMMRGYIRETVDTGPSEVDQLAKLSALKYQGGRADDEYAKMKAKGIAA